MQEYLSCKPLRQAAFLFIFFHLVSAASCLSGPPDPMVSRDLKGLTDVDEHKREVALADIANARSALVGELMRMAADRGKVSEPRSARELAIDLLGYLRAEGAVDFLLDTIDFSPPTIKWADQRYVGYPCVRALVEIGKPASLKAVERLGARDISPAKRRLLVQVVKGVEGDIVARFMLTYAKGDTKDELVAEAYGKALAVLPTLLE